jgi:inner membrane protein
MDNLTHSLVGVVIAKAGAERLSPCATTVCVLAANAPDIDVLTRFGGHWTYLHHHRGLTHSIVGTLALALLIPTLFCAMDWLVALWRQRRRALSFRGLLLASLIASATHPLMDWTNNYGVRPLLPWNRQWFYGDLVFITDPWIWLMLGGAAFLLTATTRWRIAAWTLLAILTTCVILYAMQTRNDITFPLPARVLWFVGLTALIILHRLNIKQHWGRGIAVGALSLVVAYWGALALAHDIALSKAEANAKEFAARNGETLARVAAMPLLANPLHWRCVAETGSASYLFDVDLNAETESSGAGTLVRYQKPVGDAAKLVDEATRDWRAQVFLEFSRFPVSRVDGDCVSETFVQIVDLRYTEPGAKGRGGFTADIAVECAP